MPQGIVDTRSPYASRITDDEPNHGGKGKLNASQIEERFRLHARRLLLGSPTVREILAYWEEKYHITVAEQSEAEWVKNNRTQILAIQNDMIEKGELPLPKLNDHMLIASLSEGARYNADLLRMIKHKTQLTLSKMDGELSPYKVLGIDRKTYMEATDEQRKNWEKRAELEISYKRSSVQLIKELAKVGKEASASLVEMVEVAHKINQGNGVQKALVRREAIRQAQAMVEKNPGTEIDLSDKPEVGNIEELRRNAGIEE